VSQEERERTYVDAANYAQPLLNYAASQGSTILPMLAQGLHDSELIMRLKLTLEMHMAQHAGTTAAGVGPQPGAGPSQPGAMGNPVRPMTSGARKRHRSWLEARMDKHAAAAKRLATRGSTVSDLKAALKERGLSITGNKANLQLRLKDSMQVGGGASGGTGGGAGPVAEAAAGDGVVEEYSEADSEEEAEEEDGDEAAAGRPRMQWWPWQWYHR
jgi:hypothetical protein